ncbi:glycosyl hydrolase family 65 central catalytic domain-containing protein [Colletotrichum navitas]|uniref:alpha,alpha-trehalase n=1 Tax=Colletotrichum navitas TaxID=681940 RepID=A0AAD8PSN9_9PEZI|nr:glycosyl hydrolase family 65 central catalytic domain-containing protein [Colletotrichum navitas]KAK1579374.1 glycosyl hydrolase family 65 central catalytic domain-containing protein [Colletotrichum navitas]
MPAMNLKALLLASVYSLRAARGAPTSSASFDINADWVSWDDNTWTLKSTKPQPGVFTSWLPQSNGYFGLAQGSLGPFYERSRRNDSEGWPSYSNPRRTFATVTGFWSSEASTLEPGELGESFISGVPHFTDLLVEACGSVLNGDVDVSEITEFESTLSFKTGILTWSYVWSPPTCVENQKFLISYESLASMVERRLAAVKLAIFSEQGLDNVYILDRQDNQSALRTRTVKTGVNQASSQVYSAVSPMGVDHVMAYVLSSTLGGELLCLERRDEYSSDFFSALNVIGTSGSANSSTTDPQSVSPTQRYLVQPGLQSATVYKYAAIASTEHYGSDTEAVVSSVVSSAIIRGYHALREEHSVEVGKFMSPDFVADFRDPATGTLPINGGGHVVEALQITAISSAYYLYTSLIPWSPAQDENPSTCIACNSLAVGGLVSQTYGGKIFWDADLFVAPAIQGVHPKLARQFSLYRINRAEESRKNTKRHNLKDGSMLYAWTSGRYGQCYNMSAPCIMYQYHLNADIALSMTMGRNTSGDRNWYEKHGAVDVIDGVATGLSDILTRRENTGLWGIDVMADADEYYMWIADGSFTSTAVSTLLQIASEARHERGIPLETNWLDQLEHMSIPTSDDGVVLEFQGMTNDVFPKQADVILSHYPYDYKRNFSLDKYRAAMDFYAVRTDPHGPAMTWSMYAITANSLATSGCAFWTYLVKSFQPYIRGPWYQYSEQQDDEPDVLDPLTGNPINPAFPFLTGHGGLLQIFTAGFLGLRVTHRNLVINPSLPPQLRDFKPPIQYYNGAVVSFRMNRTHTFITRRDASHFDGLVPDQYGEEDMPITVGRGVDDPNARTVFLRINDTVVVPNRLYDAEVSVPGNVLQCHDATSSHGELAFAATDGYGGTFWQSGTCDVTAAVVVDLGTSQMPRRLKAIQLDFAMRPPKHVKVSVSNSSDFEPGTVLADQDIRITKPWIPNSPVVKYVGNMTTIQLTGAVWSGVFAKLEITGCWTDDGAGATVAEFGLLAADLHE